MITCYLSNINCLRIYYNDGVFMCLEMMNEDKILFDVLRKDIEIYESDLSLDKFRKLNTQTTKIKLRTFAKNFIDE